MNENLSLEAIEVFYNDFRKLLSIKFDNSEYEIKSTSHILRKFLIDNVNINNLWSKLGNKSRVKLTTVICVENLTETDKINTKIYLPFFNIITDCVINHYLVIKADSILKNDLLSLPVFPKLLMTQITIGNYIKQKIVVDGNYITKKDVIEYISYEQGYIHFNINPDKIAKIKNVKKLRFEFGVDNEYLIMFSSISENNAKISNENLLKLGEKHNFETLMILQIIKDITLSNDICNLYKQSIEYLKKNKKGFEHEDKRMTLNYNANGAEKDKNWL
tara:strand:+ start:304 stop:1128 length:825 start_codon:yes stop_codon:yes gene_type:complete